MFLYSSRCSAVIKTTSLLLLLLVSRGQGRIDGSWDRFSEALLRRIHGHFEVVFMPVSARGCVLFMQQDIGQLRKGL